MLIKHTCTKATLILDIISLIREKKYIVTKINHATFTLISCCGISKARTVGELAPHHFTDESNSLWPFPSLTQRDTQRAQQSPRWLKRCWEQNLVLWFSFWSLLAIETPWIIALSYVIALVPIKYNLSFGNTPLKMNKYHSHKELSF